jgi:putative FmdB family regulatory protein
MPEYSYQCPKCQSTTELTRSVTEVYDNLLCLNCSEELDGKESKIFDKGVGAYYPRGSCKGRMNSKGEF